MYTFISSATQTLTMNLWEQPCYPQHAGPPEGGGKGERGSAWRRKPPPSAHVVHYPNPPLALHLQGRKGRVASLVTGQHCWGTEGRACACGPALCLWFGDTLCMQPGVLGRDTVSCLPGHLLRSPSHTCFGWTLASSQLPIHPAAHTLSPLP